ncbi:MAG: hypothetical protein GY756_13090, partial [bacterium]|nr:hypothetical protein [bacterium]
ITIAQTTNEYKYECWMLEDTDIIDMRASYGENSNSNTSRMHDGLDVYGDNKIVIACRGGRVKAIIKEGNPLFDGTQGMILIEVTLPDGSFEYDLYMHVIQNSEVEELIQGDPVETGKKISIVNEIKSHVHFTRFSSYAYVEGKPPGYALYGTNCLNPLENFADNEYKDPGEKAPSLKQYNTEYPTLLFKLNRPKEESYLRLTQDVINIFWYNQTLFIYKDETLKKLENFVKDNRYNYFSDE